MDAKTGDRLINSEINSNFGDHCVSEAVIVISSLEGQNDYTNASKASSVNGSIERSIDERKKRVLESDVRSCVIDVKGEMCENLETEVVCRICHLISCDPSLDLPNNAVSVAVKSSSLVRIGCACKGELGNVHPYCVEAWFELKGNRQCEICGEIAKNVKGVGNFRSGEESNEIRSNSARNLSGAAGAYWRGQIFCNLLMACLVIAFVLPWFFRVKLF